MKAKMLCAMAVVVMSLLMFAPTIEADDCGCFSYPSYGYTPYGYSYHIPYESSVAIYSPLHYAAEPCDNWMYGCGIRRGCYGCGGAGGMFYGWTRWQYRPGLTPPYPRGEFVCCCNCGENCCEVPCCALCNFHGCCGQHSDEAVEAADSANPGQEPTPVDKTEPTSKEPASDDADETIPTESEVPTDANIPLANVTYKPAVGSQASIVADPSRLSNIDVRDSRGAIFTVWAPINASVTVNGVPTKALGSQRSFVSYGLKPGMMYQYTFEAVVEKDGQRFAEKKTLNVKAGAVETVAFAFPELNTKPSDDFEY